MMPEGPESASPRYTRFLAPTTRDLKAWLNASSDDAELIIRGHGAHMTIEVVEPHEPILDAPVRVLNESHPCPPLCR